VLDALSGRVINYGTGRPYYSPPYAPTFTPTPTPRPTTTPQGGTGTTGSATPKGTVQLLYWHPDTPLELRIDAGDRIATTLVIQELLPGTATQQSPATQPAAVVAPVMGGGR